jgi:predicted dehydrogenase
MTSGREPGRLDLPSVLILGGGRWARVIAEILLPIVTEATPVCMASPTGAANLARWVEMSTERERIQILEKRPDTLPPRSVVIVANAARSHVESSLWALGQGASVLVEKPFALTTGDASLLVRAAAEYSALLVPALVFRFASYLDSFSTALVRRGPVERVELIWTDAAVEYRHGEAKSYDSSVSVVEDCLPHVISIFNSVFGTLPEVRTLAMGRGGATVRLELVAGAQTYQVVLERNAGARQRILRAAGASGVAVLDFTTEPGTVWLDGEMQSPVSWPAGKGPMARMLFAFLKAAMGEALDDRLSIEPALHASKLTAESMSRYRPQLIEGLKAGLFGADLAYAITEQLQRDGRLAMEPLGRAVAALQQKLAEGTANGGWPDLEAAMRDARDQALRF